MQLKRVEATQPVNETSGQSIEDSNSESKEHEPSTDKISPLFECNPCKRKDSKVAATHYCRECSDYLCQYCEVVHRRLRTAQNHPTMMIRIAIKLSQRETNSLSCTCGKKHALFYCRLHDTLTCLECRAGDHSRCLLLSIKYLDPSHRTECDIDTYDKRRHVLKKR